MTDYTSYERNERNMHMSGNARFSVVGWRQSRWRRFVWIIVGLATLARYFLLDGDGFDENAGFGNAPNERFKGELGATGAQAAGGRKRLSSGRPNYAITPDTDPKICEIRNKIAELETKRSRFCREIVSGTKVTREYVIDFPDRNEVKLINELISTARGLTHDRFDKAITWKERLIEEYIFPPEFVRGIVTYSFDASTQQGSFSLIGTTGEIEMRDGVAPWTSSGDAFLMVDRQFKPGEIWRFSHLSGNSD